MTSTRWWAAMWNKIWKGWSRSFEIKFMLYGSLVAPIYTKYKAQTIQREVIGNLTYLQTVIYDWKLNALNDLFTLQGLCDTGIMWPVDNILWTAMTIYVYYDVCWEKGSWSCAVNPQWLKAETSPQPTTVIFLLVLAYCSKSGLFSITTP